MQADQFANDTGEEARIADLGAVVLRGGKSSRLGTDKAQLIFRDQRFLDGIVGQIEKITDKIVVVGNAMDSPDRQLSSNIVFEQDRRSGRGPLEGIRVGLQRLSNSVQFAFVTSCDVPLLNPALIRFLYQNIGKYPAIVPVDGNRVFGMTAIYRTSLHHAIDQRINAGQLRVSELADAVGAKKIPVESLIEIDPNLDSLTNINSTQDYLELLKRFGLACPPQLERKLIHKPSE